MNGLVIKVFGRYYTVRINEKDVLCTLAGRLKQNKDLKKFTNPVAVGDLVDVKLEEKSYEGVILDVVNRKNVFTRKEKGRNRRDDIIAANIDQLVVVQAFSDPEFNLRFVDRLIVRAAKESIPVLLCVNKLDLAFEDEKEYIRDYYRNTDIDILYTSVDENMNIDLLKNKLNNKLNLFLGYSGVGKSSILNAIDTKFEIKTSEVSYSTGKGRHTTTNVAMCFAANNISLIDTPGVREFGLTDIRPEELARYFFKFDHLEYNCNFKTCTHDHEPKCGLKELVASGEICEERYISYLNILETLKEFYARFYKKQIQ